MAKFLRFTVKGFGPFPVDMLRYDSCYPNDTPSAVSIAYCSRCERGLTNVERRVNLTMRLEKGCLWEPTIKRWHSFGWEIVAQQKF